MININDIDTGLLINGDFTVTKNGSIFFSISYCEEGNTPHIVFKDIECSFRKSGVFSYLIFCGGDGNKKMLDKYVKVIDQIKEEILFIVDEDIEFIMGKDFMRFKFRTDNNLPYNQKINDKVCVISMSSVFKERGRY